MQENGDQPEDEGGEGLQKKRITLSFEDYKNISNLLVLHMRNEESKCEDVGSDTGMKKIEIINWYLEQVADQIETEEELIARKTLIEKVIDRLINHDQVVIPLKTTDLKKRGDSENADDMDDDTLLVVHPNYVIE
ncbi:MCM6 family protein [Megaselia abdita]